MNLTPCRTGCCWRVFLGREAGQGNQAVCYQVRGSCCKCLSWSYAACGHERTSQRQQLGKRLGRTLRSPWGSPELKRILVEADLWLRLGSFLGKQADKKVSPDCKRGGKRCGRSEPLVLSVGVPWVVVPETCMAQG